MNKKSLLKRIFLFIWSLIIFSLLLAELLDYTFKLPYKIPNIISLLIIIIILYTSFKIYKNKNKISNKKYTIYLIIFSILSFIIQLIITSNIYFKTGWDVEVIEELTNNFITQNNLNSSYLTLYPNNLVLILIYIIIRKIPYIGSHYLTGLFINNLIVTLSLILTSLTIKRITKNNKLALLSNLILLFTITLNPWNTIIYTDTLGMLFPILVLFLYSKKKKKLHNWFLITILSFISLKLKPTLFLMYLSILIIEIFQVIYRLIKKKKVIQIKYILVSLIITIPIYNFSCNMLEQYLDYKPFTNKESVSITHYMAMGQNEKTTGTYYKPDVVYTYKNGNKNNFKRFLSRIYNRSLSENLIFTMKKLMVNFNDGTFAWSREGNFYKETYESKNTISKVLKNIYYPSGKYYQLYIQIFQTIWVMIIISTLFIYLSKNNKINRVMILTLVLLFTFVMLFEARARYLICYIPIFVVTSTIGLNNIYTILKKVKKSN